MVPRVPVDRIFGLLDVLKSYGGRADIAKLMIDLGYEIDEIAAIVDDAEMLGFVSVKEGDVKLTELGAKITGGRIKERKRIFRDRIKDLGIFTVILRKIEESGSKSLTKEELRELILSEEYIQDVDTVLDAIINWGCFAGLFDYDGESESITSPK